MASVIIALGALSSSWIRPRDDAFPSCLHDIVTVGQQLYRAGKYREAYRLLVRIETLLPEEHWTCVEYQIKSLQRLGRIRQAFELSRTMATTHPSARWCYLACELVLSQGDVSKAREWLSQGSILQDSNDDDRCRQERFLWERIARAEHIKQRGRDAHQSTNKRIDFVHALPYDLITAIFQHLPFRHRALCLRVSWQWHVFLVDNVTLWQDIDISHTPAPIDLSSFSQYLLRLRGTQPNRLRIHHERVNCDQLMKTMMDRGCYKLHTLDLSDVLCKPSLFYDLLKRAGPTLRCLRWSGLILKLNDILDTVAYSCPQLVELDISYCFTSRKTQFELHRFLEPYGRSLPKDTIKKQLALPVRHLRLHSIHEMIGPELLHVLLRVPKLVRLELEHCLISFIPIANMLQHCCPHLQHLVYKRHRYARQYTIVVPHLQPSVPMQARHWRVIELNKALSVTDTILHDMTARSDLSVLERLELDSNTHITDNALFGLLRRLRDTSSVLSHLHVLNLANCVALSEEGLLQFLAACPALRHVNLARLPAVTDRVLQVLSRAEKLQTLDITYCTHVTDKGITHLVERRRDSLRQVYLTHSKISPAALSFVFRTLQHDGI